MISSCITQQSFSSVWHVYWMEAAVEGRLWDEKVSLFRKWLPRRIRPSGRGGLLCPRNRWVCKASMRDFEIVWRGIRLEWNNREKVVLTTPRSENWVHRVKGRRQSGEAIWQGRAQQRTSVKFRLKRSSTYFEWGETLQKTESFDKPIEIRCVHTVLFQRKESAWPAINLNLFRTLHV
jgi:hypothetical protein